MGVIVKYEFAPVGQGLLSFGTVGRPQGPSFRWLYDCGTVSGKYLVDAVLDRLQKCWHDGSARPRIDLVSISHFDSDHISGLISLLSRFDVHKLLIPYLPLWQRVVSIRSADRYQAKAVRQYLLDPLEALARMENRPREVILVSGAGPDGTAELPEETSPVPDSPNDRPELAVDYTGSDRDLLAHEMQGDMGRVRNLGLNVRALRRGGRLYIPGFWEFVPYNDATEKNPPPPQLLQRIEALRDELLFSSTENDRKRALKDLILSYDKHFGRGSEPRNRISLFLYAGTLSRQTRLLCGKEYDHHRCLSHKDSFRRSGASALLYTGDGFLNNWSRLVELRRFLGTARADAIQCLQVMHHGARGNWHEALTDVIAPRFSVFSSDPGNRHKHPHAEVLNGFREYGPMHANKTQGVRFRLYV